MIRTIVWIVYFVFRLISTIPRLMKVKSLDRKNRIDERDKLVNETAAAWAKSVINSSGSKVNIIGEDNIPRDRPVLFVSNHQSNLDIPVLLGFIDKPKAFIAKTELSQFPIFSKWMKYMNCVFIDRSDARKSLKAIKEGIDLLKKGYSQVIFPEGTRSKDGILGEFKQGSVKLATKSGVPIVPVTIKGANEIMPKGKLIIKPTNIEVIISKPIFMDDDIAKDSNALNQRVWDIINENLT